MGRKESNKQTTNKLYMFQVNGVTHIDVIRKNVMHELWLLVAVVTLIMTFFNSFHIILPVIRIVYTTKSCRNHWPVVYCLKQHRSLITLLVTTNAGLAATDEKADPLILYLLFFLFVFFCFVFLFVFFCFLFLFFSFFLSSAAFSKYF